MKRPIRFHAQSRVPAALAGLLNTGWAPRRAPDVRILPRNGHRIALVGGSEARRIRLFAYTVTESSRNRPHERRVEITSTYAGGLTPSPTYEDVIIAFERQTTTWVGIDSRRLNHGGATHNASTFLPALGFSHVPITGVKILPMESNLFSSEFVAFFKTESLAEYLFSLHAIHSGVYNGSGKFSGNKRVRKPSPLLADEESLGGDEIMFIGPTSVEKKIVPNPRAVEALQQGDTAAIQSLELTREELLELKRRCDEIGLRGERWALNYERQRLIRAHRRDLAANIIWVSQTHPYQGYDIRSFDEDGSQRFIEVKSTVTNSRRFEITENEWRCAEQKRNRYKIYRVTDVENAPTLRILSDPVGLLLSGKLTKTGSSWAILYK